MPPQSGNLLTAHNNIESNVQVGSPQWNNEISGGGAKPFGALQGALGASLEPSGCAGTSQVYQASGKGQATPAVHVSAPGCNIQLRFNPIQRTNNGAYHSYIIVQNTEGPADPYYFRGGPHGQGCSFAPLGCVYAQGGKYGPGTPDWVPDYEGPIVPVYNGPIPCSYWIGFFNELVPAINAGHSRYNPIGKNSNSTAYTLLLYAGEEKSKKDLPVTVPGWGIVLRLRFPDPGVQR